MATYSDVLAVIPDDKGIHTKIAGAKGEKYVYKHIKYFRNDAGAPRNTACIIPLPAWMRHLQTKSRVPYLLCPEGAEIHGVAGKILVYYDPWNHACQCNELSDYIRRLKKELQGFKRYPKSPLKHYLSYFDIIRHESQWILVPHQCG